MSGIIKRVEWIEKREFYEIFFIIAEKEGTKWSFFERSTFEVRWFPIEATPLRIERAEKILQKNNFD